MNKVLYCNCEHQNEQIRKKNLERKSVHFLCCWQITTQWVKKHIFIISYLPRVWKSWHVMLDPQLRVKYGPNLLVWWHLCLYAWLGKILHPSTFALLAEFIHLWVELNGLIFWLDVDWRLPKLLEVYTVLRIALSCCPMIFLNMDAI